MLVILAMPSPAPAAEESKPADVLPPNPGLDLGAGGHWGLVKDSDWIDHRWSMMDTGRFFCSSLGQWPRVVAKAMAIRLGDADEAAVCFDERDLSFRAGWTGKFLALGTKMFGLIENPQVAGEVRFFFSGSPAWGKSRSRFEGFYPRGKRVVLSYTVDGCAILDAPWIESGEGCTAFTRTLELGPSESDIPMRLVDAGAGPSRPSSAGSARVLAIEDGENILAVGLRGYAAAALEWSEGSPVSVVIPARSETVRLKLLIGSGKRDALDTFLALVEKSPPPEELRPLTRPGERLWPHVLETRGELGGRTAPWAIDTIGVPYDNPYKALMFITGHDFFENGDAAVCTIHGDVWLVRGIDEKLENITWKRFATGLYQPFGVRIVGGRVHVIGRDQITILNDRNGDDEADHYENFSNEWETIPWPHQFSACLETDRGGNFYFVSPKGVHRVPADGRGHEVLASGWRNPIGLSVGPDGTITVAPQEGEWTPASQICEVKAGGYYGYPEPRITPERPLGYDPPLCYIPRHIDSSSGGQVWVPGDRRAPLEGQLLNFSYGRCTMQLVLRETVGGVPQGGVVPLRGRFLSGAMRGRFHPIDGQLYVTGSYGWVTSAAADGSFQRVRYTGSRIYLPTALNAHANGLRIRFSEPLERETAEDAQSYVVQQWGYRYTKDYGSEEYSIAHPDRIGHDPVRVRSATLLEDERSVFLEIPDLRPVMQMHVKGTLAAADGGEMPLEIFNTIHRLRPPFEIPDRPGDEALPEAVDFTPAGEPGLILALDSMESESTDTRVSRLAALSVPGMTAVSPFLPSGPFRAVFSGDLNLAERSWVTFSAEGNGAVRLSIDGSVLLVGEGEDLSALEGKEARLKRGGRKFRLEYRSPASGDAWFRLYWSGRDFARETVSPLVFTHDPKTPPLAKGKKLRQGRELFAKHRCSRCHAPANAGALLAAGMPELAADAPSLRGLGSRLHAEWIERWLLDPRSLRTDASMPGLAGLLDPGAGVETVALRARDIAAFLAALRDETPAEPPEADGEAGAAPDAASSTAGGALFEKLGCISCHTLPGAAPAADPAGRVPLRFAARKWKAAALGRYLMEPGRHHRWTRMPDFKLGGEEAGDLAAFLLKESEDYRLPPAADIAGAGDADRGRQWVETTGCLNCHESPAENRYRAPSFEEMAGADWSASGCAADRPSPAPRLGLPAGEREALRLLRSAGLASLGRRDLAEFSHRRIRDLRCIACHDRDGQRSHWTAFQGETGHLAPKRARDSLALIPGIAIQTRPALTHMGDKLRTEWLREFIGGDLVYGVRPWLDARMPRFPAGADFLAQGISLDHGWLIEEPPREDAAGREPSSNHRIGEHLLGRAGGFSCVSCHPAGDRPAEMQLHFGAINLRHARERLRREFYLRWMLSPQRVEPGTPMPSYTDEDGITAFTNILGGDGRRQFEAIWDYLGTVR